MLVFGGEVSLMDSVRSKAGSLQQRLASLSSTSKDARGTQVRDCISPRKMVLVRPFKRKDLIQLINTVWKIKERVMVERLSDVLFKFCFSTKEDRDTIFDKRPWAFSGAHLNLKMWDLDIHFQNVNFDTFDFPSADTWTTSQLT